MIWFYKRNRRSTLTAIILHFMVNFVGEVMETSLQAETFIISGWILLSILIVWCGKMKSKKDS